MLGMVAPVLLFAAFFNYTSAQSYFEAKLSLLYNMPHELEGSRANDELIEELIVKNDWYFEEPNWMKAWKPVYLMGYKKVDIPGSENFWRKRPKQCKH